MPPNVRFRPIADISVLCDPRAHRGETMTRRRFVLIAFWAIMTAAPALACDDSPDLDILPGESRDSFDERYNRTWERLRVVWRYEVQKSLLAKSTTVYLGQVSSRRDLPGKFLKAVIVRP